MHKTFQFLGSILFILFVTTQTYGQISPCPNIFNYVKWDEPGKWYGKLKYTSEQDLIDGVFIVLVFDKPSISVGADFGQNVLKKAPKEYLLRNLGYELKANTPLNINFFIEYDPRHSPPVLTGIRVNARQVCPPIRGGSGENGYITSKPDYGGYYNPEQEELELDLNDHPQPQYPSNFGSSIPRPPGNYYGVNNNPIQPLQNPNQSSPSQREQLLNALKELLQDVDIRNKGPSDDSVSENVQCGMVTARPVGLIAANGVETTAGEWPWHVGIMKFEGAQASYLCGGSLISDIHILTAAHCVSQRPLNVILDPSVLSVFLGKINLRYASETDQQRDVAKIFVHPDFSHTGLKNDIAVLKLKSQVRYNDYVRPVCLWKEETTLESIIRKKGTVIGWGLDESAKISNVLRKVDIPVVPTTDCILSNVQFFSNVVWQKNYCAGFANATSVCNGDSGGGMFFPLSNSFGPKKIWQIRGLVSVGVGNEAHKSVCDSKDYTVFTDVAQYLTWIENSMRN